MLLNKPLDVWETQRNSFATALAGQARAAEAAVVTGDLPSLGSGTAALDMADGAGRNRAR